MQTVKPAWWDGGCSKDCPGELASHSAECIGVAAEIDGLGDRLLVLTGLGDLSLDLGDACLCLAAARR